MNISLRDEQMSLKSIGDVIYWSAGKILEEPNISSRYVYAFKTHNAMYFYIGKISLNRELSGNYTPGQILANSL